MSSSSSLPLTGSDPYRGGLHAPEGRALVALAVVFIVLMPVSIALRVWAKNVRGRPYALHDHLIFAALPWAWGVCIICLVAVLQGGLGLSPTEQVQTVGLEGLASLQKVFFASAFIWVTSTQLVRLSLLHLYSTIFANRAFRYLALSVAALSTIFWLGYVIAGFLICRPLAYNWDKTIPNGTCGNATMEASSSAAINMVLDFLLVIMPLPTLWKLQMPMRKKVLLSSVFCVGLMICCVNIARVVIIETKDVSASLWLIGLLALLESCLGVMVASLALVGPLIVRERIAGGGRHAADHAAAVRPAPAPVPKKVFKDPWSLSAIDRSVESEMELLGAQQRLRWGNQGSTGYTVASGEVASSGRGDSLGESEVIHVKRDVDVYNSVV